VNESPYLRPPIPNIAFISALVSFDVEILPPPAVGGPLTMAGAALRAAGAPCCRSTPPPPYRLLLVLPVEPRECSVDLLGNGAGPD
jgi:hypothetical protein